MGKKGEKRRTKIIFYLGKVEQERGGTGRGRKGNTSWNNGAKKNRKRVKRERKGTKGPNGREMERRRKVLKGKEKERVGKRRARKGN